MRAPRHALAIALALAAAYIHSLSPSASPTYDFGCLLYTLCRFQDRALFPTLLVGATIAYSLTHQDIVVLQLLKLTEVPHGLTMGAMRELIPAARMLPSAWRGSFVDGVMHVIGVGDHMGSALLQSYGEVIRNSVAH